uniref:Uncharacterized protein n=1 Tax=Panagrolaimus superbus TaxID=310955 RepID=A0A914Y689_9BILA
MAENIPSEDWRDALNQEGAPFGHHKHGINRPAHEHVCMRSEPFERQPPTFALFKLTSISTNPKWNGFKAFVTKKSKICFLV